MLIHLSIDNYALIDHLDIDFYRGFTAITGETGAGKSILLDALDLVLGKRADTQVLLDLSRKCIVEATFSTKSYNLDIFFESNELDNDGTCILRREISPNGKSRAFINDTPVTLLQLKALGDLLVDIHAQHATTSLQDPMFQLSVVDSFAGTDKTLASYQDLFLRLKTTKELLSSLVKEEKEARSTLDYKQFLFDELTAAALQPDEQQQLEETLTLITHAEEIKNSLFQAKLALSENEDSILSRLATVESVLNRVSSFLAGIGDQAIRVKSSLIELKDIDNELAKLDEKIEFHPEQMKVLQDRLDLIYRLQHKHQVPEVADLLAIRDRLSQEMANYSSLENQIRETEEQISVHTSALLESADLLTESRKNCFQVLEEEIFSYLRHMGIPDARFEIHIDRIAEKNYFGQDHIEFFFNANKGHALKPLAEIASGGELSRVMLAIKSVISDKKLLPTIIFDEIDNGLSGDIAGKVGEVLEKASGKIQVIAVTHLPQIAGKAINHYSVYKQTNNNVTLSNIKFLGQEERINELAKMIGGREVTEASLAAAKELLN